MHKSLKFAISSLLTGVLSIGLAWAGASLTPVPKDEVKDRLVEAQSTLKAPRANKSAVNERDDSAVATPADFDPAAGQVLVGASAISIEPQPGPNDVWERDPAKCKMAPNQDTITHAGDFTNKWPENPNCIYAGGYGLGPANPITSWNQEYGLAVRTVAIGDGTDTVIMSIIDATSYFGKYNSMCDGCGAYDIAQQMGAEFGLPASSFFIASTHSHTAPDLIGGWGGVPKWYMNQITDAIKNSMRESVAEMRPALLEGGETIARQFSNERRDFYRSAEDPFLTWVRAIELKPSGKPTGNAIATIGVYSAHPVTVDWGEDVPDGMGDADFPAVFEKEVEERFGGVGLYFMGGLGNVSPAGGEKEQIGSGLADAIPALGAGRQLGGDVATAQTFWDQPATNVPLTSLGTAGFFDRPFASQPGRVSEGKHGQRKCNSASPLSVNTAVSAAKVGGMIVTGGPGELFSNITNTIKERRSGALVLPIAQVNDGLGYIVQSFETDHVGRQGVGFVGQPFAEYEDAYSIDHCFGDAVLEKTLGLLGSLG